MAKNAKGVVDYKVMQEVAARCGTCLYYDGELHYCEIVAGPIEADMVCALFTAQRPNRIAGREAMFNGSQSLPYDMTSFYPDMGFDVTKSRDELRYTLGPLYVPNTEDAHGEFVTPEDLQKAAWDYVRQAVASGDNTIYRQHTGEPIGEWVEIAARQDEHTVTLMVPQEDGTMVERTRTFPAGTVYQGVVWNEEVWPDVKKGKIRGLSFGGRAKRVEADLPG